MLSGEPVCAAPLHFVPFAEEVPRAVIDMLIDRFIRRGKGAIASICLKVTPSTARRARIGAGQRVGVAKNVLATDLVVKNVEAESGLRLRLTIKLSLKAPDNFGCFKARRQSPSPRQLRKHTRSQGPFLRRHYPASTVI